MIIHLFVDKKLQQKIIIHFIPTIVNKTLCAWFTDTKGDIKEKKLNNKNVYTWLRVINYVQLVM